MSSAVEVWDWTERDRKIVEDKYLHPVDGGDLMNMIHRVTREIAKHATDGHLAVAGCETQEEFADKLTRIVVEQKATWNSPVWFNVGIKEKPQCWACLILSVDDDMDSIVEWWKNETHCFLGGSGSGVNLSRIRADGESLSGGKGIASGPLSFERAADSIAGSIKSGGRTRRAAKMVILDIDHPDIEEFIDSKHKVERMKRVLVDAGFDMGLNGADSPLMQYQNANISVRITDEFMSKLGSNNDTWPLTYRTNGEVAKHHSANALWRKIAESAWDCADPGVQFHDTINRWHTTPSRGEIRGSNPCSEYMHIDDSVCNLASHNLMSYQRADGSFDFARFADVTRTMIASMDIIVDMSSYPNEAIEANARGLRNLGLGTTNIGAMLMSVGIPYDSDEGRSYAAALHSYMMANAVQASAELAHYNGTHDAWSTDAEQHMNVLKMHASMGSFEDVASFAHEWEQVERAWRHALELAEANGQRNAQLTVIAPTGTISFMLGAETTGIEPVMSVEAEKELVGGGKIDVGAKECVRLGLEVVSQQYNEAEDTALLSGHPVFQTAIGENALRPEAHVLMMAAVQPSISGAISKTVMMPASATVEDVASMYRLAYDYGLKSVAIYRDGSKGDQPVRVKSKEVLKDVLMDDAQKRWEVPTRAGGQEKMPYTRNSITHKFTIDSQDFYLTAGYYPDGRLGEIFLKASAQGSFVAGMVDAYAIAVSLGLQNGVSPNTFAEHFVHQSFEPHGVVISDSDIKMARSVVDYVWRWVMQYESQNATIAAIPLDAYPQPMYATLYSTPTGNANGNGSYIEQCPQCLKLALEWAGTCKRCRECGYDDGGCG